MSARLVTVEGLDGSGKSTQISLLAGHLEGLGLRVASLHFPVYDSLSGQAVAKFLRGEFGKSKEVHPWLVSLLFANNRSEALPVLKSLLATHDYVLLDRYVYSNIAFQSAKLSRSADRQEFYEWILATEFRANSLPRPDISFFLDVPVGVIEERLADNRSGSAREYLSGSPDIHETDMDLQYNVRLRYLEMCRDLPDLLAIDCVENGRLRAPDSISQEIVARLS